MRIAEFSESSKFWTHIALSGYAWKYVCISVRKTKLPFFFCVVRRGNGRCEVSRRLHLVWQTSSPFKYNYLSSFGERVIFVSVIFGSLAMSSTSVKTYRRNLYLRYVKLRLTNVAYGSCFCFCINEVGDRDWDVGCDRRQVSTLYWIRSLQLFDSFCLESVLDCDFIDYNT